VPAERRDWAEALWAEAGEVPPRLARLAWRAGGMRLVAREALLVRRAGRSLAFAAAAAWVTWAAWPGPAGNIATAVARVDVVTVLLVLAGLPLLARRLFGPPAAGPVARVLRAGAYAAVLILTVAKASVEQVVNAPPAVARQAAKDATEPWLAGSAIDPVVALAWILLLGGPLAAGGMAGWRYRGPGCPGQVDQARVWQGVVAGFLATGVGALIVTAVGTGTVALMPRSGGLLRWLYSGQHLSAAVAHNRELWASMNAQGYFLILLFFPIIGLILGAAGSSWAFVRGSGSPPGGGGPPGLEPAPGPPGGGQASLPTGTRQAPRGAPGQGALSRL
jgi:hypothetical protein